MSAQHPIPGAAKSLAEQAAEWDVRLRSADCTAAEREAFAAWCAQDPAHARAIDELQSGLQALRRAYPSNPRLRAMRDRASELRSPRRYWRIAAGIAAVALVTAAVGGWLLEGKGPAPGGSLATMELSRGAPSVFQTAVGEQSTVTLSDGSRVVLNTHSRLVVNFTPERREVTLVAGQALFEVAKNRARPFVVRAGSRQVTALGTAFDVRLDGRQIRVTLIEGKVSVAPSHGALAGLPLAARELAPGEQLVALGASPVVKVAAADVAAETSWRSGALVFNDTPLDQAVAEINRYTTTPIRVADPELGSLRINGRFRTSDPDDFLSAVVAYFPVEARTERGVETVLSGRL